MPRTKLPTDLTLSMVFFLYYFAYGCLFPLLAMYLQDVLDLNGTQVGTLMSISPIVMIVAQPLWGLLCDYTRQPIKVLGGTMLITVLIGLSLYFAHTYVLLILLFFILAVFQSAVVPITDSVTMKFATESGREYGSFALWGAVGFGSSVYTVGKLAERTGLSIIFIAFAAVLFICFLFALQMPTSSTPLQVNLRKGIHTLLRIRSFTLFLIAAFLIFGPILANNFYFSFYIKEAGGTLTGIGIVFLIAVSSEIPFMKIAGSAIRRWGVIPILVTATLVSGARWVLYYWDLPLLFVYVTSVLQGFSVGLFIPAAIHFVYEKAPADVKVTAVSLYSMMGVGLGTWFCTFIGGILVEVYSVHAAYLFFSVLTFCGLGILLLLSRAELHLPIKIAKVEEKNI